MGMYRTLSSSRVNWPTAPGLLKEVKRPSKAIPDDLESERESKIFRSIS